MERAGKKTEAGMRATAANKVFLSVTGRRGKTSKPSKLFVLSDR